MASEHDPEFQQLAGDIRVALDDIEANEPPKFGAGLGGLLGGFDPRAMAISFVADIVLAKVREGLVLHREDAIEIAAEKASELTAFLIDQATLLIDQIAPSAEGA
jgi:hypothetical protein